ncbi:hypothetical protein KOI35_01640 [Actinoplanes bogorensis]|uniref:Uncharacterized protein n=1 Tax=Paractinoplanes bogorensis TaxID=1610840 RepID=A0ABS5YFQ8_9ACTN|nr:hypothetical protein [Actinoplanes bogorensis]MBU2662201.1 hypothetical protein [Actinoplanes bogorensis]
MDGRRYADEPEPTWYSGAGQYARSSESEVSGSIPAANPYDSGIHERPSGAFRLPEQRPSASPYALPESTGSHARPAEPEPRMPVRGPEYPTIRPTSDAVAPAAPPVPPPPAPSMPSMAEPTALVPPVTERKDKSVYASRRPVTSILVAVVTVVLMIPVVRLLIDATFTGDPSARAIVPAVLLTLGFTLTGIGLFTVSRGGPITRDTWLRPPAAYLPAGLILLIAAGLAVA